MVHLEPTVGKPGRGLVLQSCSGPSQHTTVRWGGTTERVILGDTGNILVYSCRMVFLACRHRIWDFQGN